MQHKVVARSQEESRPPPNAEKGESSPRDGTRYAASAVHCLVSIWAYGLSAMAGWLLMSY